MKESISDKERFFSKVSHDLRGSFTSILGFSDIINDPSENLSNEEVSDFAERIGKQSKDTFDLLVNFINWLKVENYDYGLTLEEIDIKDILYEAKVLHNKDIKAKEVSIDLDVDDSKHVQMDYEILSSIVNNIFIFLLKTCNAGSSIQIKSLDSEQYCYLKITSPWNNKEASFLHNIDVRDLNNDLSFPLIFAIKLTEKSGGEFNFTVDQESKIAINLKLPV